MFGLTLPWGKIAIGAAIVGIIGGIIFTLVHIYNSQASAISDLQKEKGELTAARDNLVQANTVINNQLLDMVSDQNDRQNINASIQQEKADLRKDVGALSTQLEEAIEARKKAELAAGAKECMDPNPGKPVEVDITWKAYCVASKDPSCKTGSK